MHTVRVARSIPVSAARAWEVLDDFGAVYRYHPVVDRSPIKNGVASGLGAERVCHFDNGAQITELVTGYEAGREYTVEITDPGKFPLKTGVARLAVEATGPEQCVVSFHMSFQPKFGPIGWVMGKTMMKAQFRKILGSVLEGLETHLRTGEVVTRRGNAAA